MRKEEEQRGEGKEETGRRGEGGEGREERGGRREGGGG